MEHTIEIYSDCSGLRNFQVQEITQMQNSRMVKMKSNLHMYNYRVSHIKGKKNHIADLLSRRPVWLNLDPTSGPDEGIDFDDDEDLP